MPAHDPVPENRLSGWALANRFSTDVPLPRGDQGLFMETRVSHEMGGFAPLPIMQDLEWVRRLPSRGTVVTLPHAAVTPARRWQRLGVLETTMINQAMIAGFSAVCPSNDFSGCIERRRDVAVIEHGGSVKQNFKEDHREWR